MSSSNIVVRVKYQHCNDLRKSVGKTISYISDKKKADATSIDEYDILKDYMQFANNDSYLYEDKESFTWSSNGDIDAKKYSVGFSIWLIGLLSYVLEKVL